MKNFIWRLSSQENPVSMCSNIPFDILIKVDEDSQAELGAWCPWAIAYGESGYAIIKENIGCIGMIDPPKYWGYIDA